MKTTLLIIFLAACCQAFSQRIFTEEELLAVVRKFHPVAKQAALDVSIAKSNIRIARGAFDPQLLVENSRKEFDGTNYYDRNVTEVKIPTWYGVDIYAGTEDISGSRLNPEETNGSLHYLGVSVPVLQNLVLDKRRAAVQQAKNLLSLSEIEKRIVINDLVHEAVQIYWNWWEKHRIVKLIEAALQNVEERAKFVKAAYLLGDRPAIDTVEALTQVQYFQIKLSEAQAELLKSRFELSAFLWSESGIPFELPADISPQLFEAADMLTLPDLLYNGDRHPELTQYGVKMQNFRIYRGVAFQSLLPDVRIKYNQIGYSFSKTINAPWFNNNYTYGLSLSLPLRLSEGRGEFRKASLQIERTRLEQANKQVMIHTKIKQYYTEWQQAEKQLSLQRGLVENFVALQKGEEVRLLNGESSLFLVNARETKTIEARQDAIELEAKTRKAVGSLRWSAGLFAQ